MKKRKSNEKKLKTLKKEAGKSNSCGKPRLFPRKIYQTGYVFNKCTQLVKNSAFQSAFREKIAFLVGKY
jgi:hypothetical protein